jgi:ribosomal protein S20
MNPRYEWIFIGPVLANRLSLVVEITRCAPLTCLTLTNARYTRPAAAFLQDAFSTKNRRNGRGQNRRHSSVYGHKVLNKKYRNMEEAMLTIHHALDPQQQQSSDFMHRLLSAEETMTAITTTKLAYFVHDQDDVALIEQDLSHFRSRILLEQQQGFGGDGDDDISTTLPLLQRAVDTLHRALGTAGDSNNGRKNNNENHHRLGIITTSFSDNKNSNNNETARTMLQDMIMDFAGAIERGDEDSMNAFVSSHRAVIAKVLKANVAVLHDTFKD